MRTSLLAGALSVLLACGEESSGPSALASQGGSSGAGGSAVAGSGGGSGDSGQGPGAGGGAGGASTAGSGGSSAGGAAGATAGCGSYAPGDALAVCTATYLAGAKDDAIGGLGLASDGAVLVGMTLPSQDLGAPVKIVGQGGEGAVVRLDPGGRTVLGVTRLGKTVTDLEVDPATGNVAVTGDFGVALLDPTAATLLWQQPTPGGAARRVGVQGGLVGALAGKTATLYDGAGKTLVSVEVSGKDINDVAVDGVSQAILVTGYKQDDGDKCQQYKSTFIRSYGLDGKARWTDYDWTRADVAASDDCADSTGLALSVGRDGKLYYAGKSDGGNTVHRKDPRDLGKDAPVVSFDQYNQAYGFKGANSIGFYARLSLTDGQIEKGQFVVARKGPEASAEGNAAGVAALTADEQGNVFLAGTAAFRIEGQDSKTVGGQKVGAYASYEGFLLIVSPDFSKRLSWTSFSAGGPSDGRAVAAAGDRALYAASVGAEQAGKGLLVTSSPLLDKPQGGSDGYLVVLPAP